MHAYIAKTNAFLGGPYMAYSEPKKVASDQSLPVHVLLKK